MTTPGVRFFAIGRFSDDEILAVYATEKKNEQAFREESKKMLGKIKTLDLKPEERQKCKSPNGAWFVRVDSNQVAYLALCSVDYPERHVYKMIDEAQANLEKITNYADMSLDDAPKKIKVWLSDLVKKYHDLKTLDPLYAAQENVSQIQDQMSKNINQVMKNMESLDNLESKTVDMKSGAQMFQTNSAEMQKVMYWRLWRMRILFGVVIIFIIWLLW
jgi:vesicle-associated membrane protein 7